MRNFASAVLVGVLLCSGPLVAGNKGSFFSPDTKSNKKLGFDPSNRDTNCKPCDDFNRYANGGWMDRTKIPNDIARWGSFIELSERNQKDLHDILEEVSKPGHSRSKLEQQIGDFYASGMDEAKIEELGTKPIQPLLAKIASIKDLTTLQNVLIELQASRARGLFVFFGAQDSKHSTQVIGNLSQGGLGLPERDYYFKTDPRTLKVRAEYGQYITRMFQLLGDSKEQAEQAAKTVVELETKLAEVTMTRTEQRDPNVVYNIKSREELVASMPNFPWDRYLKAIEVTSLQTVNVRQPRFFQKLNELLASESPETWKTYFRWHLVNSAAPSLPARFVNEHFSFHGKILNGTTEIMPRWKRMTELTDQMLGEALGQIYVKKHFTPEAKASARQMVLNIKEALREDLKTLDWMSNETREQALAKLDAITIKVGYPDKWRDYSSVKITRDSLFENLRECSKFLFQENMKQIGKPVDRTRWGLTPATVNAYYSPQLNEIVFPAGILQPPFFDPLADDAVNYGGIGTVIGHEITHGFDDQGSQFDKEGNLKNWWTAEDLKTYKTRASCVEKQFSEYKIEDTPLNGKLVLGESIADLGGLALAFLAYQRSLGGKSAPVIDGFTGNQRFFMGYAQIWQTVARPEFLRLRASTDPHPPSHFRLNGSISNFEIFSKTFGCKQGDPMVRSTPCRIW